MSRWAWIDGQWPAVSAARHTPLIIGSLAVVDFDADCPTISQRVMRMLQPLKQLSQVRTTAQQSLAAGVSSNFRLGMDPVPLFFDHASGAFGHPPADHLRGRKKQQARRFTCQFQHAIARRLCQQLVKFGIDLGKSRRIADGGLRRAMSAAGRRTSARYDWPKLAQHMLGIYDRAARGAAYAPRQRGIG